MTQFEELYLLGEFLPLKTFLLVSILYSNFIAVHRGTFQIAVKESAVYLVLREAPVLVPRALLVQLGNMCSRMMEAAK